MGDHAPKQWPDRSNTPATTSTGEPEEFSEPQGPDATDAARELAAEHEIDLADVTGTGADGRITKDDVQSLVDQQD